MQAGRLRHRINLQVNTPTRDATGGRVDSWATYATVWAAIVPLQGMELIRAQELSADINIRVEIRYNAAVTPDDRVLYGTRQMDINSVINPEERDRNMFLMCKELVT